jgi:hypothetical protein
MSLEKKYIVLIEQFPARNLARAIRHCGNLISTSWIESRRASKRFLGGETLPKQEESLEIVSLLEIGCPA